MTEGKIIIITGLSGSGKSTAIKALEDVGFFCVDNLPVGLLRKFLELQTGGDSEFSKIALVMDIRAKEFISSCAGVLESLSREGYHFEILYLEAAEEILLRRYSQTRMQHPLGKGKSLREAIQEEREQLKGVKEIAHRVIDTSHYNVHELKSVILAHARKETQSGRLNVHVLSFGFKYGLPHDADLVMDVRFLPNPYFVSGLRALDGTASAVSDFVMEREETRDFLGKYLELLDYLIPLYEKEGKSYLTVAVGCTGGRHRSVVIAETIRKHLTKSTDRVDVVHRDIELK